MKNLHSKQSHEFSIWLTSRINNVCKGYITDPETEDFIKVLNTKATVLMDITSRKALLFKQKYLNEIQQIALDQARANPNDPFTYNRVIANFKAGLCDLDTYNVEFRKGSTDLCDITGKVIGSKVVEVPVNMKRL